MRYCPQCGAAFRSSRTCPKDRIETDAEIFDPLIGRVLGDRYRVLGRIAAGGMGQVYRVAHTRIACAFALKVVWGDFAYDAAMQTRFAREAEVASCLQSRHIVRVIDFSHDSGSLPYLVMELLEGPSLYDVIVREGPLAPDRAMRIARGIARGLAHAHERGVVHRDLKPENVILVTEEDERDVAKILDFGVARLQDGDRLTGFGATVGTPLYMAPEQLLAQDIDGRTDLYALGILLYEMLTGRPPFDAPSLPELTRQHLSQVPDSLRPALEPRGAGALADITARLLKKRPDDRFANARELILALTDAFEAPKSLSIPPSLPASRVSRKLPVEAATLQALSAVITQGAPRYNAGDVRGCYELYKQAAERIVQQAGESLAVSARLSAALSRASSRSDPTDAAWDMRYAFDDLLGAQPALITGDRVADEVAFLASIGAKREAEGRFDMLGDYQLVFARYLADKLRSEPSLFTLVGALDAGVREGMATGGGQAALRAIEPVLTRLRTRASAPTQSGAEELARVSVSPAPPSSVSDEIKGRIARAIRIGAPAFNQGRPEVCARVYRDAAKEIIALGSAGADAGAIGVLQKAVQDASGRAPSDAAWLFRHAFDALLASG